MNFDAIDKVSLYRLLVALGAGFLILIGCAVVLQPFIPALMLALIFSLTTWPAYAWLNARLGGGQVKASLLMTLILALAFIVPLVILGTSVAENFAKMFSGVVVTLNTHTQDAPAWLTKTPVFGKQLGNKWEDYAGDREKLLQTLTSHATTISGFVLAFAAAIGKGLIDLTLGVIITYFFFRYGLQASERIRNLIQGFAGERGQHLLLLSKKTMIGVIYGVLGTAIAQGAFAALGFWIADIPGAAFLGLLTFFLSIIPFGPPLIWIPATMWLVTEGNYYSAIFMAVYGAAVISMLDNIVRPYFISVGSNLPILLVLMGIIGGILAFGFIGLFIGPVLLAIAMTLIMEWSNNPARSKLLDISPPV
jgi:predicted PurR-regulated permease PerM